MIDEKTKKILSARMTVGQPQLSELTVRLVKSFIVLEASRSRMSELQSGSQRKINSVLSQSKMSQSDTKIFLRKRIKTFEPFAKFYRLCSDTMADFLVTEFALQYHEKAGNSILSLANLYDKSDEKKRAEIEKKVRTMREGFLTILGENKTKKIATKAGRKKYLLELLAKARLPLGGRR